MKAILLGCALCLTTAQAADREFNDVVRVISDEFHTRPIHIPFFGLVNAFTAAVRPAGAKHIDVAVFESLGPSSRDLPQAIRSAVGSRWSPLVHVQSYRKGHEETVFVYMRQQGQDWKLLVAAIERDQATVVQLMLNPSTLARWLSAPDESARRWNRDWDD